MRFQCAWCSRTAVFPPRSTAAAERALAEAAGWQLGPHYDLCPRCRERERPGFTSTVSRTDTTNGRGSMVIEDELGKWDEPRFEPPVLAPDVTPETVETDLAAIVANAADPETAARQICQYFRIRN